MEEMIERIADLIIKYGMETPAILFFESVKPLAPIGGPLSRFFVSPWLHIVGINTRHVVNTLEEPENIEKLIQILEKHLDEKQKEGKKDKSKEKEEPGKKVETKPKKGWRRFFRL